MGNVLEVKFAGVRKRGIRSFIDFFCLMDDCEMTSGHVLGLKVKSSVLAIASRVLRFPLDIQVELLSRALGYLNLGF